MEPQYNYMPCEDYKEFFTLVDEYILGDWFPVFVEVIFSTTHVYYVVARGYEVPEVTSVPIERFESWYKKYAYMPKEYEFVAETFVNSLGQSTVLTVVVPAEPEAEGVC